MSPQPNSIGIGRFAVSIILLGEMFAITTIIAGGDEYAIGH